MGTIAANDDFLAGNLAGLEEAARLVEHGLGHGVPLERVLVERPEAADRVQVARTLDFDETAFEYVPRAR